MARKGLQIYIHGCDGSVWPVHGPEATKVRMGIGQVRGLFASKVRTDWTAGARQTGGTMRGRWFDSRDLELGFHVVAGDDGDQEETLSEFRLAFDFREDDWDADAKLTRIQVVSDASDRSLDVQLYEEPDFDPEIDPISAGYGNPKLKLRAGQPFWYEPDVVTTWSTGSTSGSGVVTVSNPTDTLMYQRWILTRGTWTLPDVSWAGPPRHRAPGVSKLTGRDDSARTILMPALGTVQGGGVVDLDPQELMVRDAHDTNLLGQMPVPGRFFEYAIPPHTPATDLPVSVTAAPTGGAMVKLVQPRRWLHAIGGQ